MTTYEYDLDEIIRDVRRILTMTNDVESAHGQALPGTLNHDGVPTYEMERLYHIQITANVILSRLEKRLGKDEYDLDEIIRGPSSLWFGKRF